MTYRHGARTTDNQQSAPAPTEQAVSLHPRIIHACHFFETSKPYR